MKLLFLQWSLRLFIKLLKLPQQKNDRYPRSICWLTFLTGSEQLVNSFRFPIIAFATSIIISGIAARKNGWNRFPLWAGRKLFPVQCRRMMRFTFRGLVGVHHHNVRIIVKWIRLPLLGSGSEKQTFNWTPWGFLSAKEIGFELVISIRGQCVEWKLVNVSLL